MGSMKLGLFHFQLLYSVLERIHFIYNEDELANTVLSQIAETLNADGGSIFQILPDGSIIPLAAYGVPLENLKKLKFTTGKGVVGWVAQYAQPVKVDNPREDTRFLGAIDTTTGFKTKSIIAAPILIKGKPVGIIEFLNRRDGPFAIPDIELISMVGREIGIAFENVRLLQKIESNRAFQEAVLNSLSAGVLVVNQDNRLTKINPRAKEILAVDFEENTQGQAPLISEVLSCVPQMIDIIAESNAPTADRKEVALKIKGRNLTIGYSKVPVIGKDNSRLGTAVLFQDVTKFTPSA